MAHTSLPPLLYASTQNADQLWFSRVGVHDPFIAFSAGGKRVSAQSALEFGRVRKSRAFDRLLSLEDWRDRAARRYPGQPIGPAEIIATLAHGHRLRGFRVADDFPASLYVRLGELGVKLELARGPLFPQRLIKTPREAAALREGNRLSAVGFTVAENILRQSRIRGRELIYDRRPLTSERLRLAIDSAILAEGGRPDSTIVAGGNQACDPHETGHGPLRPHEMIILDIFPRVIKTGYFGDMTRTYLRGRASDAQRRLYATVHAAQRAALAKIRAGVSGQDVHRQVTDVFDAAGYATKRGPKGATGFFHGTGHGVGLEIHEAPRISATAAFTLPRGVVFTVEPGLYYPGLGGCRIEDVVQATTTGHRLLSHHGYDWEIR